MAEVDLATLGWTDGDAQAFAALTETDLVPGRLALEHNHVYRVLTESGELLAEAAGRMKHEAEGRRDLPVVGDWVAVRLNPSGRAMIRAILPRRTRFSRKAAGRETEEQILAANVDAVFLVFGLDKPVNARAIERYVVVARQSGASPLVVLNKADLAADVADAVAEAATAAGDTPVVAVSTISGSGFDALEARLAVGRTVALLGPSGAGKSSIINRLIDQELLATGAVREWDARGRHTSVHRHLVVRAAGGLVIDTPGMRELQLWGSEGVVDSFADIAELGGACRFRDCRHDREPGCAVKAAVAAGTFDGGRYQSYLKLQAEEAALERKRDERAQAEAKRATKIVHRAMRSLQRDRDREGR